MSENSTAKYDAAKQAEKRSNRLEQANKERARKALAKKENREEILRKREEKKAIAFRNAVARKKLVAKKQDFNQRLADFIDSQPTPIAMGSIMTTLLKLNETPLKVFHRVSKGIEAKYTPYLSFLNQQAATLEQHIAEQEAKSNAFVRKVHLLTKELNDLQSSNCSLQETQDYYKAQLDKAEEKSAKIFSKKRKQGEVLKNAINERLDCINEINSISKTLEQLGESNDDVEVVNSKIYEELEILAEVKKNFPNSKIEPIREILESLTVSLLESCEHEKEIKKTLESIFKKTFNYKVRLRDINFEVVKLSKDIDQIEEQLFSPLNELEDIKEKIKLMEDNLESELSMKHDEIFQKYHKKSIDGIKVYTPVEKNGKLMALKMWEMYQNCIAGLSRITYGETRQNMLKIAKIFPNILCDNGVKKDLINTVTWLQHTPHSLKRIPGKSNRLAKQKGELPRGMQGLFRSGKMRKFIRATKWLQEFSAESNCSEQALQKPVIELLQLRAKDELVYMDDYLLSKMANKIRPELAMQMLDAIYIEPIYISYLNIISNSNTEQKGSATSEKQEPIAA